jgi:hypothetical protein
MISVWCQANAAEQVVVLLLLLLLLRDITSAAWLCAVSRVYEHKHLLLLLHFSIITHLSRLHGRR